MKVLVLLALVAAVTAVAIGYALTRRPHEAMPEGLPRSAFPEHFPAWNGSVAFSFPRAQPVPEVMFNQTVDGFIPLLMEKLQPVVIKGSPVLHWAALRRWKEPGRLAELLGRGVQVHTPAHPVVRVHHTHQPFEALANWTRPFREALVAPEELLRGDRLYYGMFDVRKLARQLGDDVRVSDLTVPWRSPLEVNVWVGGTSGITTPAHYDMVHNVYAQIVGYKRFILFPPSDAFNLYTFTNLHPSARQTQVDFNSDTHWARFPDFAKVQPQEVVLGPGDVLYLPPFVFHQVSVVTPPDALPHSRDAVSVSVSVHTTCNEVDIRSGMIDLSLKLPVVKSWPRDTRVCALFWHLAGGVFANADERVTFVTSLLRASFSHFDLDDANAPGLHDKIREARRQFAEGLQCGAEPGTTFAPFVQIGQQVRRVARTASSLAVTSMLMSGYIQDCSELLLGPLDMDPFLRWLLTKK
jgi:hypothetical protein